MSTREPPTDAAFAALHRATLSDVTDRLGRVGEGFVASSGDLFAEPTTALLVVDRSSARILAFQLTFSADSPTFTVPAGSVLQYSAWLG